VCSRVSVNRDLLWQRLVVAFDSRTKPLLIANHAILSANPANYAVLWMFVGNPGNPPDKPILP
jgi:hypothetical protein